MRVISECVLMRLPKKLSKLVHAYWNYSLPKLVRFWNTV